nr:PHP domain-containing protein [Sphingomonas sp. 2SG]
MADEPFSILSNGARFFRADLHIHSYGASHDVKDSAATPAKIVKAAADEGIAIISLADHNEVANIPAAQAAGAEHGVFVVPGVELSTPEGHLLCYAPTYDAMERFFNRLDIADRRTDTCRCQNGMHQCLNLLASEGGFAVIAHLELAGAFESNMPRFTPAKLDILCHPALEGIEVTRADCPILYTDQDGDADRRAAAEQRIKRLGLGSSQHLARVLNSDSYAERRRAKRQSRSAGHAIQDGGAELRWTAAGDAHR